MTCEVVLSGLAGLLLFEILEAREVDSSMSFRLTSGGGDYSLELDKSGTDDCVAAFKNRIVLVVTRWLKDRMGDCRIDARVDDDDVVTILLCREGQGSGEAGTEIVWQSKLP